MPLRPIPLLWPLSLVYRAAVSLRNRLFDAELIAAYRPALPVICVGNVSVGGSGKTPFVQYLAGELIKRGFRPAILTRGYGAGKVGPHLVQRGDSAADVGDEALLHILRHPNVPIVISQDRAAGARMIEDLELASIIVLDDGYQHRRLERNKNVLLLDCSSAHAVRQWAQGHLLPAGYLREPLSEALARADAIVLTAKGVGFDIPPGLLSGGIPTYRFDLRAGAFRDVHTNVEVPLDELRREETVAAAAIADPEQFFRMLDGLGIKIRRRVAFADHHAYRAGDWEELRAAGLPVICTEKDAVKLRAYANGSRELLALELAAGFKDQSEDSAFWESLLAGL